PSPPRHYTSLEQQRNGASTTPWTEVRGRFSIVPALRRLTAGRDRPIERERVDAVAVARGAGRPGPAAGVHGDVLSAVAADVRRGRSFDSGVRLEAPELVARRCVVGDDRVRQRLRKAREDEPARGRGRTRGATGAPLTP